MNLGDGGFAVSINTNNELSAISDELIATPDWDEELASLDQLEYALPQVNSNVQNGVGYVIGIVSKTIDLTHCTSI